MKLRTVFKIIFDCFLITVIGVGAVLFVKEKITGHKKATQEQAEQSQQQTHLKWMQQKMQGQVEQQKEQLENTQNHKPIVIKGLYIGMDTSSLPSVVADKGKFGGIGEWKLEKP